MADGVKNTISVPVGPSDIVQKLMVARDLTRRSGIMVELQVQQLRLWPLAVLGAKSSECDFDFDTKRVYFKINGFEGGEPPADLTQRLNNLRECVQFLLGPEYVIQVKNDRKILR